MKVAALTAEHVGQQVEVVDPDHVTVAGMLVSVTHTAVLIDDRTLTKRSPRPVVTAVAASLVVGGVSVDIADGDLAQVRFLGGAL